MITVFNSNPLLSKLGWGTTSPFVSIISRRLVKETTKETTVEFACPHPVSAVGGLLASRISSLFPFVKAKNDLSIAPAYGYMIHTGLRR
jgi:hypothetical protein